MVCDLEAPSCGPSPAPMLLPVCLGLRGNESCKSVSLGIGRRFSELPSFLLCSCSIHEVGASLPLDTKPLRPAGQGCPGARLWTRSHIGICATGIPRGCRVMGSNLCSLVLWSLYSFSFAVLRGTGDSSNNFQVAQGFKNTSAMQLERYLARSILNKC